MSLMPLFMLTATVLSQEPPPPIIHTYQPASGVIEATWNCPQDRQVRYRIETQWDRIRIQSFAGSAGEASAEDLARLNEALEPIWVIADLNFTCNSGADELVIGGPVKGDAPDRVIMATWYNGRMRLNVY